MVKFDHNISITAAIMLALTLSGLTAIHSKVCGFVGLQASFLHSWSMNLHVLWVTAFSNGHLRNAERPEYCKTRNLKLLEDSGSYKVMIQYGIYDHVNWKVWNLKWKNVVMYFHWKAELVVDPINKSSWQRATKKCHQLAEVCLLTVSSHPEWTVGNVDLSPCDDDSVFDGLGGYVDTEICAVTIICDLDVDGEAFCVLE